MVRLGYYTVPHNGASSTQAQSGWINLIGLSRIFLFSMGLCCGVILSVTFFAALRQSRVAFKEGKEFYRIQRNFAAQEHSNPRNADSMTGSHSKNETFHKDEDILAQALSKKVRVLCLVFTKKDTFKKNGAAVNNTWGSRCNILLFISNFEDRELPVVNLQPNEQNLKPWGVMKAALNHVYENFSGQYDWILKADDDTFVVLENLRYLLSQYSPGDPLYLGCRFKNEGGYGYMNGGSGIVLSKEAVRQAVVDGLRMSSCQDRDGMAEDVAVGNCMETLGVTLVDSRDSLGRGRFFPLPLEQLLIPGAIKPDNYYFKSAYYPALTGFGCCSDTAISFHGIGPGRMHVLNYLLYHLRPYGINHRHALQQDSSLSHVIK